ncbi:hypothetical protein R1sor_008334 [Riccia sorocarpa]|uniref:HAT C-terminal dimerisation domain-containing protein n=1 Tax=Riccia sorocarpa TaxID=122646 RepID=A0ABD3HT29_9MARC
MFQPHLTQLTKMDASTCIGCGRSGYVYLVGAVDPELADQIGRFDVVFYVAKRLKDQWYEGSGFDELVKEFTTFQLNSPIICSPTTGFFDRLNPTLITGEELRQYLRSVDKELDGIACMDTSIWTQEHREKALSEECRTAPMLWWAQAGRNAPLLRVIAMNILGLTCTTSACERAWSSYGFVHSLARVRLSIPRQHKLVYIYHNARIKAIDQKRERKTARVLNAYWKSRTQQSILKRRHGAEYGSTPNPRDAWIPDEVLEATGPEIGLSTGERVRIKTWDWTEPVCEDEVLDDKLQERNSRDNPQRDGQSESNVDPVENVVYYDDIGDHDFPDDSALQVEDPMVLPGMEIGEEDGLDDYYNISSNWIDQDSIARYTMVDAIDTRKVRTLGVSENQVVELNKKFGNRLFPKVTLNVPGVTIMSKKLRILKEIYSMPVERTTTDRASKRPRSSSRLKPINASGGSPTREDDRGLGRHVNPRSTDDSSLPRGETSSPTTEPSSPMYHTSSPGGETSSPRADNSSPRARTLRNQPLVDYRSQLNPPNVFR